MRLFSLILPHSEPPKIRAARNFVGIVMAFVGAICYDTNMLTDTAIRALKPGPKPIKRSDGAGLFIQVSPSGAKLWRLAYRFRGKQKLLSGGPYPYVKLADARRWRDEAREHIHAGRDPGAIKKAEKAAWEATRSEAFKLIAEEWMESRCCAWTPRYARVIRTRLTEDIFPWLGDMPIGEIEPVELLTVLRKIEARGSIEMAHRIKNYCSEVFRYGIAIGRCKSDPCRDIGPALRRPPPVKHRAKVEARDLPDFYRKLSYDQAEPLTHLALRWTMLTMVRTQETRFAEWH